MAMILAVGAILHYLSERTGSVPAADASRAVYESVLEATAAGVRTPDIGGDSTTTEFTDEVVARVRAKLGSALSPRPQP
jgi:isocitrate dehydrogenase (NAD+)